MREIRIGPGVQIAVLVAILAALGLAAAAQLPELQRYMKIRSM